MARTSPGAPTHSTGVRSWRSWESGLRRGSRHVCLGAAVGTALLGALFSPPLMTLVVAPAAGLFGAGQVALILHPFPARTSFRRAEVLVGAGCALVVPFTAGATSLGVTGAALTMTVLLTGTVVLAGWLTDLCRAAETPPSPVEPTPARDELIAAVPTSVLLEEWRLAEAALSGATDPVERTAAARACELMLAELTRRDPAGVHRWPAGGAGGSSGPQVRDDPAPGG